jgi:OOP family OmpA-OmpF porin
MKRTLGIFAALASLGALPLMAQADNYQGWYGSVTGGVSSYGNSQDDEDSLRGFYAQQGAQADVHVDDNPGAFGLGIGYHVNENFALEAGWLDLGQATANVHVFSPAESFSHETKDAHGITLDAYGLIPVSRRVSLFGKLGMFNYTLADHLYSDQSFPMDFSSSGTTWDFGIGAEVHFTQDMGLRAGFTSYHHVGDANSGQQNIGLAYGQFYLNF